MDFDLNAQPCHIPAFGLKYSAIREDERMWNVYKVPAYLDFCMRPTLQRATCMISGPICLFFFYGRLFLM